jgi:hypothetical protein
MNAGAIILGMVLFAIYIGVLVWAIAAPPFTIIAVAAGVIVLYDIYLTIRYGENGSR